MLLTQKSWRNAESFSKCWNTSLLNIDIELLLQDGICVVDLVMEEEQVYLSDLLVAKKLAIPLETDPKQPSIDFALKNFEVNHDNSRFLESSTSFLFPNFAQNWFFKIINLQNDLTARKAET